MVSHNKYLLLAHVTVLCKWAILGSLKPPFNDSNCFYFLATVSILPSRFTIRREREIEYKSYFQRSGLEEVYISFAHIPLAKSQS